MKNCNEAVENYLVPANQWVHSINFSATFDYDAMGNLIKQTDANGHSVTNTWAVMVSGLSCYMEP